MAEYIAREAAMDIVKRTSGDYAAAWAEIRKLPAADVEPVVYGYWDWTFLHACGYAPFCSACRNEPYRENDLNMPTYCPSCGAKMQEAR